MAKARKKNDPKLNTYRYYIINIKIRLVDTAEDLPALEYARIFREFYLSGSIARSGKQKDCLLTTQAESIIDEERTFFGQFAEITNLNNKKWFHKQRKELDPNFRIPNEYAGNAAVTSYFFIPSVHRFAYRSQAANLINPYNARTYFRTALRRHLSDGYVVDVDVESDLATIQRILEAPEVVRLSVRINYANNDFSKEMQEFVENDMKASNTGELRIQAVPKDGTSLQVTKSRILGGAVEGSVSNGETEATIVDDKGKKHKLSTANMPRKLTVKATKEGRIAALYKKIRDEYRQK